MIEDQMICFNRVYRVSLTKISYFFPIATSTIGPNGNKNHFYEFRKHLHNITEHPELKWLIFVRGRSLTPTPFLNRVKTPN